MVDPIGSLMRERAVRFMENYRELTRFLFFHEGDNKSYHNGEYGRYREDLCKEFINMFIPSHFGIGDGFVINKNKEISKQCDIVLFDKQETPRIESSDLRRFFPIETVYSVGEVKSNLNKTQLKEALKKLQNTKFLRESPPSLTIPIKPAHEVTAVMQGHNLGQNGHPIWDTEKNETQNIVTFLICESIEGFDHEKFYSFPNSLYERNMKGIPKRHNALLSIEDGYFSYFKIGPSGSRDDYPFPQSGDMSTGHRWCAPDKDGSHVISFINDLTWALSLTCIYPFVANNYMPQVQQKYAPMG